MTNDRAIGVVREFGRIEGFDFVASYKKWATEELMILLLQNATYRPSSEHYQEPCVITEDFIESIDMCIEEATTTLLKKLFSESKEILLQILKVIKGE